MSESWPFRWNVLSVWLIGLAALSGLVLMGLRLSWVFLRSDPLLTGTSGFEEEALFSIWKFKEGLPVYSPLDQAPFSGSYFNGLFYLLYGGTVVCGQDLFHLADVWLPALTRGLTFTLFLGIGVVVFWLGRRVLAVRSGAVLLFGLLFVGSPLFGWWTMTTRPDIAALTIELILLGVAACYLKQQTLKWMIPLAAVGLIAWGFRQTNLSVAGCLVTWQLLHRRWSHAVAFAALLCAGAGLTVWLAGDSYRENTLLANTALPFDVMVGLRNLGSTLGKAPWLLAACPAAVWVILRHRRAEGFGRVPDFLAWGTVLSLAWAILTSTKTGASDNYYFAAASIAALFTLVLLTGGLSEFVSERSWFTKSAVLLIGVQGALALLPMVGVRGRWHTIPEQRQAVAIREALQELPQPSFVTSSAFNLPWINPASPSMVFAFVYRQGALKDHPSADHGIEGLIQSGHFATIIRPAGHESAFDDLISRSGYLAGHGAAEFTTFTHTR